MSPDAKRPDANRPGAKRPDGSPGRSTRRNAPPAKPVPAAGTVARGAGKGRTEAGPQPVLTGKDRRHLRALGNQLRPTVMIGREGLTEAVLRAVDQAHRGAELIKLKILEPGEVDRKALAARLDAASDSQVVGMVGGVILLYRKNRTEPKIVLPSERED